MFEEAQAMFPGKYTAEDARDCTELDSFRAGSGKVSSLPECIHACSEVRLPEIPQKPEQPQERG